MNQAADPQAVAEAVAEALSQRDRLALHMGMSFAGIAPGRVAVSMTVREDMLNGLDMCHGGAIFSLADVAFAVACNSHNVNMVAANCTIHFLAAARQGDVLTAQATETLREGRAGIYDITVIDQSGKTCAVFRGNSRRVDGQMIPDLAQ